jgi:hypothetical protein
MSAFGRGVRDLRSSESEGHRSARSEAKEDWEGAAKAARPRILHGTGRGNPPRSSTTGCAERVRTQRMRALTT